MSTGVGLRIRNRRKELGLSQESLAERMNLKSKSTICKIERGEDNLTADTIVKYADALNCTPSYLMGWEDEDPSEAEMDAKANYLWELYTNASPEVQSAVETLLKAAKHD